MTDSRNVQGISDYVKEKAAFRLELEKLRLERNTLRDGLSYLQREIAVLKIANQNLKTMLERLEKAAKNE